MSFLRGLHKHCRPTLLSVLTRPALPLVIGIISLSVLINAPTALAITLPSNAVHKSLQTHKIDISALSIAAIPLNGQGRSAYLNADVLINPASTMKLVTTYAALELLGPAYQWKTEFLTDGTVADGVLNGNLYLKGGGDPKLNMERLWMMLRDLRANGVRHVSGDLILDRNHFIAPPLNSFHDDSNQHNKPYLVEPDSLLVNFKAQRFIVRGEASGPKVVMEPPVGSIEIINNIKLQNTKSCSKESIKFADHDDGQTLTLTLNGSIAPGCRTQSYLAYLDHPRYASGIVRSIWQELGGTILGNDMLGQTPKNATLLVRAFSPDVAEVIRDINKYSNNTMAKQLFLSIGAHYRTTADANDAVAARRVINGLLNRKNISTQGIFIENGSGLSRKERITSRQLGLMLQAAWKSPYAAEFIASMPLVGMDGTMRRRLKNTPAFGQAHIKTGTLRNVRATAGYSRDTNGNNWAVVAIINHDQPWGASKVLDQVLLDIYNQPNKNSRN
ncbi:D-alanyl-D-alanine carboxypeptidase/D-alanyl-D-alanine-endopeptidase [Denitrificimonas sp. JX-1]|uniref:D-alanyl-D-alanine carboxypeptidase/D-alanyl-D-alanine-endopeptidase n=1 Tax=Denitrificimonas halotolerans TaxID=3098930 RepID=A0ABU5GQF6_9GAMM|nr:D-alanyl-D-alanine carboxypeptidase/D-alanyl-D-alanine-endopeptidase [Denitrificimonas sp. JX-1]MDY7218817.1 D-alanyl-D-alanine carboxypeptidase/D-alanyl-D-alanine-endopeptidase [Denitrificimonas sp. JX-1]